MGFAWNCGNGELSIVEFENEKEYDEALIADKKEYTYSCLFDTEEEAVEDAQAFIIQLAKDDVDFDKNGKTEVEIEFREESESVIAYHRATLLRAGKFECNSLVMSKKAGNKEYEDVTCAAIFDTLADVKENLKQTVAQYQKEKCGCITIEDLGEKVKLDACNKHAEVF